MYDLNLSNERDPITTMTAVALWECLAWCLDFVAPERDMFSLLVNGSQQVVPMIQRSRRQYALRLVGHQVSTYLTVVESSKCG